MFVDFVLNGEGHGPFGQQFGEVMNHVRYDPGMMRPYYNRSGRRAVTISTGRMVQNQKTGGYEPERREVLIENLMRRGIYSPVFNATALRKEEWVKLDQVVLRAARQRLRAWADLAAANSFGGFDAMAVQTLEHETMSDPGEAVVDMDGLTEARTDRPLFRLQGIPLPITHGDFYYGSRELAQSRKTGTPLDTTTGEAKGRRIAEKIEQTTIGTATGYRHTEGTYAAGYGYGTGGSTGASGNRYNQVYGYTNYPDRLTKTDLTAPTAGGWTPETTFNEVNAMVAQLADARFYGPFMLYYSTDWQQYMNGDYYAKATSGMVAPTELLRDHIKRIDEVTDVRRLDFLTDTFTLLLVQMTPDVARAINGLDITTVQWESVGGMRLNFKVMCIQVPQIRSDYNGRCGILHGTTA